MPRNEAMSEECGHFHSRRQSGCNSYHSMLEFDWISYRVFAVHVDVRKAVEDMEEFGSAVLGALHQNVASFLFIRKSC